MCVSFLDFELIKEMQHNLNSPWDSQHSHCYDFRKMFSNRNICIPPRREDPATKPLWIDPRSTVWLWKHSINEMKWNDKFLTVFHLKIVHSIYAFMNENLRLINTWMDVTKNLFIFQISKKFWLDFWFCRFLCWEHNTKCSETLFCLRFFL